VGQARQQQQRACFTSEKQWQLRTPSTLADRRLTHICLRDELMVPGRQSTVNSQQSTVNSQQSAGAVRLGVRAARAAKWANRSSSLATHRMSRSMLVATIHVDRRGTAYVLAAFVGGLDERVDPPKEEPRHHAGRAAHTINPTWRGLGKRRQARRKARRAGARAPDSPRCIVRVRHMLAVGHPAARDARRLGRLRAHRLPSVHARGTHRTPKPHHKMSAVASNAAPSAITVVVAGMTVGSD
jgi:hypothetical protein